MLQFRRILLSGLVALLMVGMVNASDVYGYDDAITPDAERPIIGAYFGTWNEKSGECHDSKQWGCIRLWADFRIPWW